MTDYTYIIPTGRIVLERDNRSTSGLVLLIDGDDDTVTIDVRTTYSGDNGQPMCEWHRRRLAYTLASGAAVLDRSALAADLADGGRLAVLIDRIRAGHTVDWDGSNWVGRLTADAHAADDELGVYLYDNGQAYIDEQWAIWDETEWFADLASAEITATTTDAGIDALLAEWRPVAASDLVILTGDARDWMIDLRDQRAADAAEDEDAA